MAPCSRRISVTMFDEEYNGLELSDLQVLKTLGIGTFGRVELVQIVKDPTRSFALKKVKKSQLVKPYQRQRIIAEKEIMMESDCDFIVKLYTTFKDDKYLYILTESCLGGELWTILRNIGHFNNKCTRFYAACIIEGFDYLHSRNIVYRDLKPENLLLDETGYLKLTDLGFAKRLKPGTRTFSFCGTSHYISPEVIRKLGHDITSDYWALGILIFQMFTGYTPFDARNRTQVYRKILKGISAVPFPKNINGTAGVVIKGLCRDNPAERLGCREEGLNELRNHKWFDGFKWEGLRAQKLKPPIIPNVQSVIDTTNFDDYQDDTDDPPPADLSDWDADF